MPLDTSVLAALALGSCFGCIVLVFHWGRKLQATSPLRDQLVEATAEQEKKFLILELDDESREPLDPEHNPFYGTEAEKLLEPPSAIYDQAWMQQYEASLNVRPRYIKGDPKAEKAWEDQQEIIKRHFEAFKKWGEKEKRIYEDRRRHIDAEALRRAKRKVPESMDISLLGGGWIFLLEFSTVIVIIFAVVILGILGTLQSQEISTILAAIAGYVLGKAAGTAGRSAKESQSSAQ